MNKSPFLFLLGGIFSLMIAMGIARFAYTPILPLMQNSLGFTDAMAGYLASSNYLGYFIGAFLAVILPLKRHRVLYLRLSLIGSILTTCLMGFSQSLVLMLIIRLISGVTSAFIFVLASSIVLDRLATTNKTSWSGYFYSGVGLGIFLSTLFVPSLNMLFRWQGVWFGLAATSLILTIFVWSWLKEPPTISIKKIDRTPQVRPSSSKWLPYLMIAYGLEGLGYIVTGTFIVSIAEKSAVFSFDPAIVWIIVGFTAIPSCIIWSTLAEKCGLIRTLILSMLLQSIGIALPAIWLTQSSLIISACLFGATFMGITTLATTAARQMNPTNSSIIIGYLTAIYAVGQMIGPALAGILSTYTKSFHFALLGAASCVLIGAFLLLIGIRSHHVSKKHKISTIK